MLSVNSEFILVEQHDDFAGIAAQKLAQLIRASGDRPQLISLSGGSTPFPAYRRLAKILAGTTDSGRCFWMQTDERLVDSTDESSNQRGIRASLMADGFLAPETFFPAIAGKAPTGRSAEIFEQVCAGYLQSLQQLPAAIRPPAPIDLLILGIGNDGHTASLFADTDWLTRESSSGFAVFETRSQPEPRISLTLSRILQARRIVILVSGTGKRAIMEKIFFDPAFSCPASYVARQHEVTWILDADAAGNELAGLLRQRNSIVSP